MVRVTSQSTTIAALPITPSQMKSSERDLTTTIAQRSCATALATKKSPKPHYSSKCSETTAKWMAAAPVEADATEYLASRTCPRCASGTTATLSAATAAAA